jgi:hypothetical protein
MEPLIEVRALILLDLKADVLGIGSGLHDDIAGIKLAGDAHGGPLSGEDVKRAAFAALKDQ